MLNSCLGGHMICSEQWLLTACSVGVGVLGGM